MAIANENQIAEVKQPNSESRLAAYVELTKLRISVMVLITFIVAAVVASGSVLSLPVLFCATIGMLAIAASGNAMNMYLERYSDFLMKRTKTRPLPTQRLTATEVALFGAISLGVGAAFLFTGVNWQTGLCGVCNWILYVFIYTPMKRKTSFNTEVGAIAGAMPVIMGCLATTQTVNLVGWSLFGVLVFWQFPHFMAIAWKYRHDYAAGGLQMLTVVDPSGKKAGRKAIVTAVLTLAVSLLPILVLRTPVHGIIFAILATVLGGRYLLASINFNKELNLESARSLLLSSLVYLPCYMLVLLIACLT